MRVLPLDLVDLPSLPPLALTIGNYDGVHLGHQSMLKSLVADAKRLALSSAVMVFEPQPREFFSPDNPPARLSNLNEKTDLIASLGVDFLLVADFNDDFRKLPGGSISAARLKWAECNWKYVYPAAFWSTRKVNSHSVDSL